MDGMPDKIESTVGTQPGEIINRVERSEKDKDQQGFSKALKEKMKEELLKKKRRRTRDEVSLTESVDDKSTSEEKDNSAEETDNSPSAETPSQTESQPEHIDLKA